MEDDAARVRAVRERAQRRREEANEREREKRSQALERLTSSGLMNVPVAPSARVAESPATHVDVQSEMDVALRELARDQPPAASAQRLTLEARVESAMHRIKALEEAVVTIRSTYRRRSAFAVDGNRLARPEKLCVATTRFGRSCTSFRKTGQLMCGRHMQIHAQAHAATTALRVQKLAEFSDAL